MKLVRIAKDQAAAPKVPEWFPGTVVQQRLNEAEHDKAVEVLGVWFEAGSRTLPHTHEIDQVLQCTEGEGIVATETEKILIRPGDVVVVPAGVWHWHGGTRDSAMCHLSFKAKGTSNWDVERRNWDAYGDDLPERGA